MTTDHALPDPQAKGIAAPGLFQHWAHTSPDRLLPLAKAVDRLLKNPLDLTEQVGYTGAMAAQFIAGKVVTGGGNDGLLGLVNNPPPGTPPHARRAFQQLAHALSSVQPPNYESEHEMAQMPLSRRPTKADAERLMAEGARILNELDAIRSKYLDGVEPTEDGAVITFQRALLAAEGTFYSYAAMRADTKWYLTGTMGSIAFTWDELLFWCEEGVTRDFRLVTDNAFQPALPSADSAAPEDAVPDDAAERLTDKGVTVTEA